MSILSKIKKGVENSGSNMGKIIYTKDGSKLRVRFLQDVEDGTEITLHDHFEKGINALCQQLVGKKCPYCDTEEDGWRHRDGYVWSVWDHDAKEVKLFIGFANNYSHLPQLIGMAEAYGNWTDRDYVLQQTGKQLNKQLSVIPMDKVRFNNKKAKPYTDEKLLDILSKAYPVNESDAVGNKNGKKKNKRNEEPEDDDEDDGDENDYASMSPKELYMECVERGLSAKKKQKASYYIAMLEDDDEKNSDEDDWEDEDDDEDNDW